MSRFAQFQETWNALTKENPALEQELQDKAIPLLLNSDESSVLQGFELLMATTGESLCFLLEEVGHDIHLSPSWRGLQGWTSKDLKAVLQAFSLKASGKKSELIERINTSRAIRRPVEKHLIRELSTGTSDLCTLYDASSFDQLLLRSMEDQNWSDATETVQKRLVAEVKRMEEIGSATGDGFMLGKYPVTQVLWEAVMGNNPSAFKGKLRPVETVSWWDCILFCNHLSEQEGLEKVYTLPQGWQQTLAAPKSSVQWAINDLCKEVTQHPTANGYRLPSEKQWQAAAQAGQESLYAGSDQINLVAWHVKNSEKQTHAVGLKSPNGAGLYDMSGNVCEWCWDIARAHPKGQRVFRGGSMSSGERYIRLLARMWNLPSLKKNYIGFRLARNIA